MSSLGNINGRALWSRKLDAAQFHLRQGLAKLPYVPVPLTIRISPGEAIRFRWSYIVPFHDKNRGFFDYWGHDLPELRFLWRVLKPGMTFFDVGAFHGIYTLVAAKRLGNKGRTVAFEPSPKERQRLKLHLRMNRFRSACVEPCALGAEDTNSTFFAIAEGDKTRGGLRPPASSDAVTQVSARVVSLDDYLLKGPVKAVDVIKLDVEGAELDVFRGASRMLMETRPIMICEVLDSATQAWGYHARDIIAALLRYDFAWFDFMPDGTVIPHQVRAQYPEIRNYLAVPREKWESGAAWFRQ